jgi:hypothetical protein
MAPCGSKVFFPDDPRQQPQFSDCPRVAKTTRRTAHTVIKLCSTCARVWDEEDRQKEEPEMSHGKNFVSAKISLPLRQEVLASCTEA